MQTPRTPPAEILMEWSWHGSQGPVYLNKPPVWFWCWCSTRQWEMGVYKKMPLFVMYKCLFLILTQAQGPLGHFWTEIELRKCRSGGRFQRPQQRHASCCKRTAERKPGQQLEKTRELRALALEKYSGGEARSGLEERNLLSTRADPLWWAGCRIMSQLLS